VSRFPLLLSCAVALQVCLPQLVRPIAAVQPSEQVLPKTTKGYVSIPDMDLLQEKWDQTQLGKLMKLPAMKPFSKDLQRQMNEKLTKTGVKLGMKMSDLEGVYGGEIAVAAIQPGGNPAKHATAMLIDVTGKRKEADEFLEKVEADLKKNGGRRADMTIDDVPVIAYTVPRKKEAMKERRSYYAIVDDMLVAVDDEATMREIVGRLAGEIKDKEVLDSVAAYNTAMAKCAAAAGEQKPHIRWFVEPFGYAEYSRASSDEPKKRGKDMLKILGNQGFRAAQGLGGFITLMTESHDILHRTFVYAPAVPGAPTEEIYELAARMLRFPNIDTKKETLLAQNWVASDVGSYTTFKWEMQKAFWYSKTLVDDVVGAKGSFDDVMKALKLDPAGPQIDVPVHLVQNLSDRATLFTDYQLPITTESERWLAAVEILKGKVKVDAKGRPVLDDKGNLIPDDKGVERAVIVKRLVDKAMDHDPDAHGHEVNGDIIWEVIKEEDDDIVLEIEGPDFGGFDGFGDEEEDDEAETEEPIIPNSAASVAKGHLIIGSHVDIIKAALKKRDTDEMLNAAKDYNAIKQALDALGGGPDSFRVFARTDETYRPTYELIRQGKMPESKTMFGKLLNRMFEPEEEGEMRKQKIDGAQMPPFDTVKDYLGPAGIYVRSQKDGWMATGCLLVKEVAPVEKVAEKEKAKASE
jgi:hypothetical protein